VLPDERERKEAGSSPFLFSTGVPKAVPDGTPQSLLMPESLVPQVAPDSKAKM
jgi:hypothetical protein